MERKVIFSHNVERYLRRLIDTLYVNNYFGFKENAKLYVQDIIVFIMYNDYTINTRKTPEKLQKFGDKFTKYKSNNQTFWYIFFDQKGDQTIINYITNNHSPDFTELM